VGCSYPDFVLICAKVSERASISLTRKSKYHFAAGVEGNGTMAEIIQFVVVPFDYEDNGIVAGEPIDCPNPAAAIQTAQNLWKTFGHAGATALVRTSDLEIGKFGQMQILRQFGQVLNEGWSRAS
jgi:hypothetical protein